MSKCCQLDLKASHRERKLLCRFQKRKMRQTHRVRNMTDSEMESFTVVEGDRRRIGRHGCRERERDCHRIRKFGVLGDEERQGVCRDDLAGNGCRLAPELLGFHLKLGKSRI